MENMETVIPKRSYDRSTPTSQGGSLVKSIGVVCTDGKSGTFYTSVIKDTLHKCPYCDVIIPESSIDNKLISDARINEEASFICESCDDEIFIHYQWICDPECESDGIEVFSLETKEDYIEYYKE